MVIWCITWNAMHKFITCNVGKLNLEREPRSTFGENAGMQDREDIKRRARQACTQRPGIGDARHAIVSGEFSSQVCKPSDTCARVVPAVLSCGIITRSWKNGFGAQRLCLPKQCVALNVPNSPKFTRAMISQHMYYINNPLFYISQRLVRHVQRRGNARDVLKHNQQCAIRREWCNRYRLHVLHHVNCITSHYHYST